MPELERVSWLEAEPSRVAAEKKAMAVAATDLVWLDGPAGGWEGPVPLWPFARPCPEGLARFVNDRRLIVRVEYSQAYPMVEPKIWPIDPEPDQIHRTWHAWHLNGDGSLCVFQLASDWDGTATASEVIPKASGWFLEYLLMTAGRVEQMTVNGIAGDPSLDALFAKVPAPGDE